jgi:hypothetical protein
MFLARSSVVITPECILYPSLHPHRSLLLGIAVIWLLLHTPFASRLWIDQSLEDIFCTALAIPVLPSTAMHMERRVTTLCLEFDDVVQGNLVAGVKVPRCQGNSDAFSRHTTAS